MVYVAGVEPVVYDTEGVLDGLLETGQLVFL